MLQAQLVTPAMNSTKTGCSLEFGIIFALKSDADFVLGDPEGSDLGNWKRYGNILAPVWLGDLLIMHAAARQAKILIVKSQMPKYDQLLRELE